VASHQGLLEIGGWLYRDLLLYLFFGICHGIRLQGYEADRLDQDGRLALHRGLLEIGGWLYQDLLSHLFFGICRSILFKALKSAC
jgi:hypothetical protein